MVRTKLWGGVPNWLIACTKIFNAPNYYRCKMFTVEVKIFSVLYYTVVTVII